MLNNRRRWDEQSVSFLKENYCRDDKDHLVSVLGRKWTSIRRFAEEVLGLKRHFKRLWTEDDIAFLKANYSTSTKSHIMSGLDRGWEAIKKKATSIGESRAHCRPQEGTNHKFFDIWSKEMAYVLGFIWADGCLLSGPRKRLEIYLHPQYA
jgi:glycerol-3-phosphate dehydrogenase